eukprot:GHVR01127735.1.p1 GENE.GHVR01127735.1~~GHVR01127735.1.p1  ORF type:complete len:254 (+),score=75.04 GHVR01127735.1:1-762(+)
MCVCVCVFLIVHIFCVHVYIFQILNEWKESTRESTENLCVSGVDTNHTYSYTHKLSNKLHTHTGTDTETDTCTHTHTSKTHTTLDMCDNTNSPTDTHTVEKLGRGRHIKSEKVFLSYSHTHGGTQTWRDFFCPGNNTAKRHLIAALGVAIISQCTGIEAATYYSTRIFMDVGLTGHRAKSASLVMGVLKLAAVGVSTLLVDNIGRRPLLVSSFLLMSFSLFSFAALIHFTFGAFCVHSVSVQDHYNIQSPTQR